MRSISGVLLGLLTVFVASVNADEYCAPATPSEVCPDGPDRDLKVAIVFDATSNCYYTRYSLAHVADALAGIETWVKAAGHSLLASYVRTGNAMKTGSNCFGPFQMDAPVADMAAELAGLTNVYYLTGNSLVEAALVWIAQHHWQREKLFAERRIITIATSSHITLGLTDRGDSPADLEALCPLWPTGTSWYTPENRPSADDIRGSILKHGIALHVWIWQQYASYVPYEMGRFEEYMQAVGITDVKMLGRGTDQCLPQARDYYAADIRELACPSWIGSTTTYAPYQPAQVVHDCILEVGSEMGLAAISDTSATEVNVINCVF